MIPLFTKPLEVLASADVMQVIGWPESMTLEFKREIPERDGNPDAWATDGKLAKYGRDKLFKEIVALANTAGGHLIIGVEENKSKPPIAAGITSVPRCVALAECILQSAQSIEPPIPLLVTTGIPTDDAAGVVIIRVPPSRMAPHRSTDKEIYVRRGTNSVPISMPAVRDMILSTDRLGVATDLSFTAASAKFRGWLASPFDDGNQTPQARLPVGFRITAIPIGANFELPRLYGRWSHNMLADKFTVNGTAIEPPRQPRSTRAILRGVEMIYSHSNNPVSVAVRADGTISATYRTIRVSGRNNRLYLAWMIAFMLNVLRLADRWRDEAGIPECEYALESEIGSASADLLELHAWGGGFNDHLGDCEAGQLPLLLPRLSYGRRLEIDDVISRFADDFCDSVGASHQEPLSLRVSQ